MLSSTSCDANHEEDEGERKTFENSSGDSENRGRRGGSKVHRYIYIVNPCGAEEEADVSSECYVGWASYLREKVTQQSPASHFLPLLFGGALLVWVFLPLRAN